jgi:hypothetical protein
MRKLDNLDNHDGLDCMMPAHECPPGPCKCRDGMGLGYVTSHGYYERRYAQAHGISRGEAKIRIGPFDAQRAS